MKQHITTAELDSIARLGLEDIKACFTANAPAGASERAELTLKILRQGTSRMSGENNRLAIALKVAKAVGASPEEQRPLWKQIANAEMTPKSAEPLATLESTGNEE